LQELAAEDVFPDFEKDLGLKRLEAKRLKILLAGKEDSAQTASAPQSRGYFPGSSSGVVVKNTFLHDDRPSPAELAGFRSQTVPVGGCTQEDEEDGADEAEPDEVSDGEGKADSESPLYTAGSTSLQKYGKLTTFDAFEPSTYWEWESPCDGPAGTGDAELHHQTAAVGSDDPAATDDVSSNQQANIVFVPTPMWGPMMPGMPPMPPMMPCPWMPMDGAAAQMQMAMPPFGGMMMGCESDIGPVAENNKSKVMVRSFSVQSQRERIRWNVDARKLKSTDREAVSPTFEVSCGATVKFKMVLKPRVRTNDKGGACFAKSGRKGYVELRCVSDLEKEGAAVRPILTFRLQIASARRTEPFRGPVRHNFADRALCGLPDGQDEWDFGKVVDNTKNEFGVVLELLKDDF